MTETSSSLLFILRYLFCQGIRIQEWSLYGGGERGPTQSVSIQGEHGAFHWKNQWPWICVVWSAPSPLWVRFVSTHRTSVHFCIEGLPLQRITKRKWQLTSNHPFPPLHACVHASALHLTRHTGTFLTVHYYYIPFSPAAGSLLFNGWYCY